MPFDRATAVAHTQYFLDEVNERLSRFSPIVLVSGTAVSIYAYYKIRGILRRSDRPVHQRFMGYCVSLARSLPWVEEKIKKEFDGIRGDIIESIHKYDKDRIFIRELLNTQFSPEDIIQKAAEYDSMGTFDVNGGRVSGTVYTDRDQKHIDFLSEIFKKYAYSNPLHPDVFPGVRKMEAEVVRMAASLFHGSSESCGTVSSCSTHYSSITKFQVSSGGTESIMLACFAYRNRAYAKGITEPVMVIPVTAHAAFDKAAFMMNIRVIHVPVDADNRVNIKAMRSAISSDTCMLVGSAPNFPTGTIDDISQIATVIFHSLLRF